MPLFSDAKKEIHRLFAPFAADSPQGEKAKTPVSQHFYALFFTLSFSTTQEMNSPLVGLSSFWNTL